VLTVSISSATIEPLIESLMLTTPSPAANLRRSAARGTHSLFSTEWKNQKENRPTTRVSPVGALSGLRFFFAVNFNLWPIRSEHHVSWHRRDLSI
jgi:hypothetical protein